MAKKKSTVQCFDRTTKAGRKYTTCKSKLTGQQLRKGKNSNVAKKAKKLAPLIRRSPPPPPPRPSRNVQASLLRRGINPDTPIYM